MAVATVSQEASDSRARSPENPSVTLVTTAHPPHRT